MAFKMKRKGFPMKSGPNKIRDYSSAMDMKKEEESPAKRAGDFRYDIDEMTGETSVKRVPTGEREVGYGGFQTGKDIDATMSPDEKKRYMEELKRAGVKRGKHGYLSYPGTDKKSQLTEMADVFELSDEFPGNPKARREATGMSREQEARMIDQEIQRKINAGEPLTEQEAKYNKMLEDFYTRKEAADSPAGMKSGFKMKSPVKRANVNVYRDGREYLYGDADDPNSVIDETKKAMEFEEKNKKIIDRNYDENREKITDLEYKIQDAEDSGNTKLAEQLQKQIDDITNQGIFKIDYSGKHAIQRNMADDIGMMEGREGSQYVEGGDLVTGASYVGEEPDSLRIGATMGEDEYGNPMMVGGKRVKYYGDPMDPKKQGTQEFIDAREESDKLLDEQRRKRKEAADSPAGMKKQKSPIEMKKGFKMKGNPYKMGKMQTASAVKMAKEAMAKMKKEESAMDMKYKSPAKAAKPDYPDIDGDGNTTESMKQAAADKKAGPNKLKKETGRVRNKRSTSEQRKEILTEKFKDIKPEFKDRKLAPNKLKKPTRKMDTAEEAPGMKAKGEAVAKMKKEDSPNKKYKSEAQRKAVHASKADGGKGNPNKMKKKND